MAYCFVIQPFDGGKFDKRYSDVFKPAIESAGLEPYRVDRDASVSIPINDIEEGIRGASVCFAEITLDNPNVWFELGFALACEKEICIICSKERVERFPFDVQHRNILRYSVDSQSDYIDLRKQITERLLAIQKKAAKLAVLTTKSPVKERHGLSQHEMLVLATISEHQEGPGETVTHFSVRTSLDRLGYNNLAVNIGLEGLLKRQMVSVTPNGDINGNTYNTYAVESAGMDWLIANYENLNMFNNNNQRSEPIKQADVSNRSFSTDAEDPF